MEKKVAIANVFAQDEMIDVIAVTKGHGFKGWFKMFCFKCFYPILPTIWETIVKTGHW